MEEWKEGGVEDCYSSSSLFKNRPVSRTGGGGGRMEPSDSQLDVDEVSERNNRVRR